MGTIYYVACRDCKVTRGLDKFYELTSAENRQEALELGERMQAPGSAFRAALLASFMWKHRGHNCTAFCENDDELCDEMDPFENENGFVEDTDFWREPNDSLSGVPAAGDEHGK